MNGLGVDLNTNDVKEMIIKLRGLGIEDPEIMNKLEDLGLSLDRICNRIPPGLYDHYKGDRYFIHNIGRDSEDLAIKVCYQSMETGEFWYRPAFMFLEKVEWKGKEVPRFTRVGNNND
ncbi:DUF1653 domain-containing protein [Vibrio phage Va2]|nr:DUF1653 domain-containing protein [Vibrio phage Va2]